jgi:glycosyltransferase involved in cell wall biosynthesis
MQYVPVLADLGIDVREFISRFGAWPPEGRMIRPFWLTATVLDRVMPVLQSHRYDLTFFQRELVSTLHTLERFTKRPRVLDVDDAVWLSNSRSERSFVKLSTICDGVICGNDFIAHNVSTWNKNVIVIPTAVDTLRFRPPSNSKNKNSSKQIIGWSGLSSGAKYLLNIEEAIFNVIRKRPDTVLRVISDAKPRFRLLEPAMVEFIRWSPGNEVNTIQEMDVGVMPIDDTIWARGKCSYKMLLYMACGVPVVVSPVGMNRDVLAKGEIGRGASTINEWTESILEVIDDPGRGAAMGAAGRKVVEDSYSLDVLSSKMAGYLRSFK